MYKLKDSVRLFLLKMKWKFEDYIKDGVKYLALGELDTVLINVETKEITHKGLNLGMYEAIINLFSSLNMLELIKEIKCLTCTHCNEGELVDDTIAMFKCDVYGLKVIGVFGCNDYEKDIRDKITQSQEVSK